VTVRAAFRAKGNAAAIQDLILWSEQIAGLEEKQKKFLHFVSKCFCQALLLNYQTPTLVYMEPQVEKFELGKFAPFVNNNNINAIYRTFGGYVSH
jgi:DNA polymerase-3 subunit delta'